MELGRDLGQLGVEVGLSLRVIDRAIPVWIDEWPISDGWQLGQIEDVEETRRVGADLDPAVLIDGEIAKRVSRGRPSGHESNEQGGDS